METGEGLALLSDWRGINFRGITMLFNKTDG